MKTFTDSLSLRLAQQMQSLDIDNRDKLSKIPQIILILEDCFSDLKLFISDYKFINEEEEIVLFKKNKTATFR